MKNSDMPAMPIFDDNAKPCMVRDLDSEERRRVPVTGLTKREMFAMHAMSAWIQHHGCSGGYGFSNEDAAISAVASADALLAELDK